MDELLKMFKDTIRSFAVKSGVMSKVPTVTVFELTRILTRCSDTGSIKPLIGMLVSILLKAMTPIKASWKTRLVEVAAGIWTAKYIDAPLCDGFEVQGPPTEATITGALVAAFGFCLYANNLIKLSWATFVTKIATLFDPAMIGDLHRSLPHHQCLRNCCHLLWIETSKQ
jgi:hypothetical protein